MGLVACGVDEVVSGLCERRCGSGSEAVGFWRICSKQDINFGVHVGATVGGVQLRSGL